MAHPYADKMQDKAGAAIAKRIVKSAGYASGGRTMSNDEVQEVYAGPGVKVGRSEKKDE